MIWERKVRLAEIIRDRHPSTEYERSVAKGVPMKYLKLFQEVFVAAKGRSLYTYKFRGKSKPGYRRDQSYIHKSMADTFAAYPKSRPFWKK